MGHACVDLLLLTKEVSRHVRPVSRGKVGESVGLIVNGLLKMLFGWPLGLESFLPLDSFRHLSESVQIFFVGIVRLVFQLLCAMSFELLCSDYVGLGRGR